MTQQFIFLAFFFTSEAIDNILKPGGLMVESEPQMEHFTALALDSPKNRMAHTHFTHLLTTALICL